MRNVLVTGGSRGIGLVIARRQVAAGYQAIAVARRESEELRVAKAELSKSEGGLQFRACDLSTIDAIPAFVETLRDEFGTIYGLVNNAGIGHRRAARNHAQQPDRGAGPAQRAVAHRSDQICRAPHDGGRQGPHRQHLLGRRLDRL
jgi:NAD(P)-dependent dehydrogenase (short-subunit alcohol dehydrogenase family)